MNAPAAIDVAAHGQLTDTRLTVPSMRCAGCIAKIERGLDEVDGIASVRVNFSAKRVAVRHEIGISEQDLVNRLQKLGFEAQAIVSIRWRGRPRNKPCCGRWQWRASA